MPTDRAQDTIAEAVVALTEMRGFVTAAPRRERDFMLPRIDRCLDIIGGGIGLAHIAARMASVSCAITHFGTWAQVETPDHAPNVWPAGGAARKPPSGNATKRANGSSGLKNTVLAAKRRRRARSVTRESLDYFVVDVPDEACDANLLDGAPGDPLTPIEVRALARAALAAAAPGETEQTP